MDYKEALKRLKQETCPCTYNPDFDKDECLEVIEKTVKEQEEELKELKEFTRIVIEKKVNIYFIKQSNKLKDYHFMFDSFESDFLNEDEYSLLKKVVEKYGKKED